MRISKLLFGLLTALSVMFFVACSNDGGENGDIPLVNRISAKWEISDENSPYASFEFNKDGNYIVVMRNVEANSRSLSVNSKNPFLKKPLKTRSSETNLSPIHFGTYKIEGNNIILSGFGVMEIINITAEEFSFSFTLEATGEKNSFVAEKSAEPISSSSRTDMLCRSWLLNKVIIDFDSFSQEDIESYKEEYGENWKFEVERNWSEDMLGLSVLFSRAGTYLVLYADGEAGLAEWKWANREETKIYYSWDNWEYSGIAAITELKPASLSVQEEHITWNFKIKQ